MAARDGSGGGARSRPSVVFLCIHNAGRSQMAAGWMRHLSGGRVRVRSGGSNPAAEINPAAVKAMAEAGIDIAGEKPLRWTDEDIRSADFVVTMGCGDECPLFPGVTYRDWSVEDPHGKEYRTVCRVRDEIATRVRALLAELGVDGT